MRRNWIAALCLGLVFLTAQANAEEMKPLDSEVDRLSYGMGVDIARNFKRLGIQFNPDVLVRAMKDELAGKKLLYSEQELRLLMSTYQSDLMQRQAEATKIAAEVNRQAGEAFLAENRKKAW
jgi:FKBP-type peptidyl-prolyl cis-trans isomerase FklB